MCIGNLENFELNRVLVQEQNWAGLRLYDSLLTDAEVASEMDKICVPADTCADVLTAGVIRRRRAFDLLRQHLRVLGASGKC